MLPGPRPPDRRPRSAPPEPTPMYPELDPLFYGLTIWDLDREFATGGIEGTR